MQPLVGGSASAALRSSAACCWRLAYLTLAFAPPGGSRRSRCSAIGLGFYMLHNTLQTNATQMAPQARGTAVALFSSALYLGQSLGVALAAPC